MKVRVTWANGQIYKLAFQDIGAFYVKLSFWLSWMILWKLHDIYIDACVLFSKLMEGF